LLSQHIWLYLLWYMNCILIIFIFIVKKIGKNIKYKYKFLNK
jgi:hypothetical protein